MDRPAAEGIARTPDGRRLAWCRWGPVDGAPVLHFHGAYGGRLWRHVHGEYDRVGVSVVTFDRPGFGGSDRHPGRRVVDGAVDAVAVADHLVAEHERVRAKVEALAAQSPEPGEEASQSVVVEALTDALGAGSWGVVDEWRAEQQPWGFELSDVRAPVRMLVARGDDTVPPAHVDWLAAQLPDVGVEWTDGDHMGQRLEPEERLLAWLAEGRQDRAGS